jgi:hypothetical protein
MPNHQKHRGPQSDDFKIFNEKWFPVLRKAVADLSFLLTEEYPDTASLKLVGDRYRLNERQRLAVLRAACSNQALSIRQKKMYDYENIKHEIVYIDAYNLLITTESILSGGIIIGCRDGAYRDLASIHGTYKRVEETLPALRLIGKSLKDLKISSVKWFLDSPISNSGRLRGFILQIAQENGWDWQAELVLNPDKLLIEPDKLVISSDSWVIENATAWFNLTGYLLQTKLDKKPNLVYLA